jgi:hypothetical protein
MLDAELSISEKVREIAAGGRDNDPRYLCLKNGGSTHQAWLVRTIDYAIAEICSAKSFAGVVESMKLGMSENGLFGSFPAPISRDHSAFASYDGANRQLTGLLGLACLLNGKFHVLLVNIHTASSQSTHRDAPTLFGSI